MRAALLALVLVMACGDDATQILVVVNTDLVAGTDIQEIELEVEGSGGIPILGAIPPVPRTALLVHDEGPLGPFRVTVRGLQDDRRRIERIVEVSFVEGKTLVLPICLSRRCLTESCTGARTCSEDGCVRMPIESLPEFDGNVPSSCGALIGVDGGMDGAVPEDAGVDVPPDIAGDIDVDQCFLDSGICGVAPRIMPGDRLSPTSCDPAPGSVRIDWVFGPGPVSVPFNASVPPGNYVLQARQPDFPDCEASFDVDVAGLADMPNTGRPPDALRDLAARPGEAFGAAGPSGPFAIRDRWYSLWNGSMGDVPSSSAQAVAVADGEPVFAVSSDEDGIFRAQTTADFSDTNWMRMNLNGDAEGFALATRHDGAPPLAVAYREGVATFGGPPYVASSLSSYEAKVGGDIAISIANPDDFGEIWVVNQQDRTITNFAIGGGPTFEGGSETDTEGVGDPTSVEVIENAGMIHLWICGDSGLRQYDLAAPIDLTLPRSSAPVSDCRDIAPDGSGGLWVAASSGLLRFDSDSDMLASLPRVGGFRFVAFAEGASRELWTYDGNNRVSVLRD